MREFHKAFRVTRIVTEPLAEPQQWALDSGSVSSSTTHASGMVGAAALLQASAAGLVRKPTRARAVPRCPSKRRFPRTAAACRTMRRQGTLGRGEEDGRGVVASTGYHSPARQTVRAPSRQLALSAPRGPSATDSCCSAHVTTSPPGRCTGKGEGMQQRGQTGSLLLHLLARSRPPSPKYVQLARRVFGVVP